MDLLRADLTQPLGVWLVRWEDVVCKWLASWVHMGYTASSPALRCIVRAWCINGLDFIKSKSAPKWPQNRSPGEFGTAWCSIFKMLRNAVRPVGGHFRFILASVYMVVSGGGGDSFSAH